MTLAEEAKEAFDEYAGLWAPELPADPWSALQVRLHRWEIVNYGLSTLDDAVLGLVEEWCREAAEANVRALFDDAVADSVIFMVQACTHLRLDFGTFWHAAVESVDRRRAWASPDLAWTTSIDIGVGMLAEVARKTRQRFRGGWSANRAREQAAQAMHRILVALLDAFDGDLGHVVVATAEQVMQRRAA